MPQVPPGLNSHVCYGDECDIYADLTEIGRWLAF